MDDVHFIALLSLALLILGGAIVNYIFKFKFKEHENELEVPSDGI